MHVTMSMSNTIDWKKLNLFLLAILILGAFIPSIQSQLSSSLSISSMGTISFYPGIIGSNMWTGDFETGTLSQLSDIDVDTGNLVEITSTVKYNGNYGMHVHKEEGVSRAMGIYEASPVMYDFHFTFAFMSENFATSGWVRLFELRSDGEGKKIVYADLYSKNEGRIYFIGGKTGAFTLVDSQWHVIDIFVSSDKNGMIFIYLDKQLLIEIYGGLDLTNPLGDPYYLDLVWIGVVYTDSGTGDGDIYYDDIRLDEWVSPERPPQSPIAEFMFYPTVPKPNEIVYFFGDYSSDLDGNITEYEWTFPDGSNVHEVNASYTFDSEGGYQVSLTVTDDSGMETTVDRMIVVYERQPVSVVGGWNLPFGTDGTQILDSVGNDVTLNLTGVAKMGMEYNNPADTIARENDPAYYESDAQLMASWGIKLSRVPFNWYYYMTDYQYREYVKQLVDLYTSNGILVLMDLHWYSFRGWSGQLPQATGITKEMAWILGRDAILGLKAVAHDFLYNPMVIGVEINEFRPQFPYEASTYAYLFDFELTAELADEVHSVNPNLLIGIEIGKDGWNSQLHSYDSVRGQCISLLQGKNNIVYMPHCYFMSKFGRSYIWAMYNNGDLEDGKTEMYSVLDTFYLYEQNYYDLPVMVTEYAAESETSQVIRDEMDYFMLHNWGSAYWAWFRNNINSEHLLLADWETPSPAGEAFQQKLTEMGF